MKLKVLLSEPTGGFWPYTPDLANALTKVDSKVYYFTSKRRALSDGINPAVEYLPKAATVNEQLGRNKYWRWALDRFMTFAAWSFQRAYYAWTVRPDVVHLQYTYSDFDQYSLSWLPNTVRVLTIHNVFPVATHSELNKNHQVLQRVYSACDGLIVHTESNKRELLNNFALEESRVRVIAHGALPPDDAVPSDVALAQLGLESNCRYLLVFGGLRASKGIDIAIEAFALLVVSDENLRLIIAGGVCADSDLQQLQQQAERLGVAERIIWDVRFVPDAVAACYFAVASVALLPYREFHSQSGVLLHCYRYGLPAVVTAVGGLQETIEADRTGAVSEDIESSAFARAVRTLLDDDNELTRCAENERQAVRGKYFWPNIAAQTEQFYRELLQIKARGCG